jgi:hypothetical protein
MNKQQTPVEWLYLELFYFLNGQSKFEDAEKILERAKEMEKERMIEFARKYMLYIHNEGIITIETFYNETYGGNK